ncbi:hypothetical protein [Mycobacterium sp. Marseille-P9652]|uniref:hypothetical protein n=1 Tax=Mycobacterium sp. Marseille-P9652 TaxID=2654950 RepID=UPI0012E9826E|nr:hypothetical protein [Mycobacterium sp. Marseille-P9652]
MFTLHVSWLLVAGVPGLLMLAALGLGRLEHDLARGTARAVDVDEFLRHAEAVGMQALARAGMPEALEYLHQRPASGLCAPPPTGRHALPIHAAPLFAVDSRDHRQAVLSMRIQAHSRVNPEFGLTTHVNRV